MKKELFNIGDLVKLKENSHVYKVDYLSSDGEKVFLDLVIGESIGSREMSELESATQADIDALQADYEFKIGEKVIIEDSCEDVIEAIDVDDDKATYYIKDKGWFNESNFSKIKTFEIGDLVKLKENSHVYKITDYDGDDEMHVFLDLVIGKPIGSCEISELESATQEDIDALQADYEFKIGEKVIFNDDYREGVIEAIDVNDNKDSYYIKGECWYSESNFSKIKTFEIGDLVKLKEDNKTIGKVISNIYNELVNISLVIGDFDKIRNEKTYQLDKLEAATQAEVDKLQKDFDFKIGEEVILDDEVVDIIKSIDSCGKEGIYFRLENEGWVKTNRIVSNKVCKETFKVGDLVKLKKDNKTIGRITKILSDKVLEVNLVIGSYSLIRKETSIKVEEVELSTQAEVDELQKDFVFKIGEEVIIDKQCIDIIESIDSCGKDGSFFRLETLGWVGTNRIVSNKVEVVESVENNFKVGDLVKLKEDNKNIGRITKILSDKLNDIKVSFVIGNHRIIGTINCFSKLELELATKADIYLLQKDFEFKIGEEVILDGKVDIIESIDTNADNGGKIYRLEKEGWVETNRIVSNKVCKETFKVGDLVKSKKDNKTIGKIFSFIKDDELELLELELVIGNFGLFRHVQPISELESATQADIDFLQKDFEFKIGEELFVYNKIDIVKRIDTNSDTITTYYLETLGWVGNSRLKNKEEVEPIEIKESEPIKPKKRLLLGAC
jgi:uncharacterized protein YodC (DUF2158 family)